MIRRAIAILFSDVPKRLTTAARKNYGGREILSNWCSVDDMRHFGEDNPKINCFANVEGTICTNIAWVRDSLRWYVWASRGTNVRSSNQMSDNLRNFPIVEIYMSPPNNGNVTINNEHIQGLNILHALRGWQAIGSESLLS